MPSIAERGRLKSAVARASRQAYTYVRSNGGGVLSDPLEILF